MLNKTFIIVSLFTGLITTICSVMSVADQIKNGDRRAEIMGKACGEELAKKPIKKVTKKTLEKKEIEA